MTPRVPVEVRPSGGLWTFASRDGRLLGIFVSRQAALRAARDEISGHPGYVLARGRLAGSSGG